MANTNQWFRLYSKLMYDPKIEFLSFEDQRHFIWLLCLKNDGILDEKYKNNEFFDRVISRKLGLQGEAYTSFKSRIIESGLVTKKLQPKQWDTLQMKSDSSAERVRNYRAKKTKKCNVTETLPKRYGNALEENRTEQNRIEERESTETQSTEVDPSPLNSAKPKKPTTKGTRIAKDWYLTDELRAWTKTTLAESNVTTINIDVEEQKFFDYWVSVAGAKATKVDWAATWRSWIRRGAGL